MPTLAMIRMIMKWMSTLVPYRNAHISSTGDPSQLFDAARMQVCYSTLWLAPFEDAPAAIWPSASIATIAIVSWLSCEGQLVVVGPCLLKSAGLPPASLMASLTGW